jgi:hypothetical protein
VKCCKGLDGRYMYGLRRVDAYYLGSETDFIRFGNDVDVA